MFHFYSLLYVYGWLSPACIAVQHVNAEPTEAGVRPHVLGIEPWPSGRTTRAFGHRIISPDPTQIFKYVYEILKDLTLVKTKAYWF